MIRNLVVKLCILYHFSLLFISNAHGQDVTILNNFNGFEADGNVTLNWVIKSGSTCNGITIFRSIDGVNFEIIGDIQGVCGNLSQPEPYSFVDVSPIKNAINCYKLELGNYGFSETVKIEIIDIGSSGYQIRPHPIKSSGKIFFTNKQMSTHQITIYNAAGKIVFVSTTEQDFFVVNSADFSSGLYLFDISNLSGNARITGRVVFQ